MQQDQNYGIKELYEVVLKAKTPMMFGSRYIEADEPVLYFENINMAVLSEQSNPIMARGGFLMVLSYTNLDMCSQMIVSARLG